MSAENNSAAPDAAAGPAADTNIPQSAQSSSVAQTTAGNELICQWQGCGERQPTPELLYDHVCERHVGRKSTNNLNLTCQWGNCRTTTVKRDHITSHIRVHVPLKPHKCDFCGKAFKRPQDLKKHVKTHADDSVLLRSPEPNRQSQGGAGGGYQGGNGKLVADLQSLAATASGYYPQDHQVTGQPIYYPSATNPQNSYHGASAPQQGSAYGPVYYAVSQPSNANAEYELRKRAAFDALNEFFGDAKRRVIDPGTYYDVGNRLASLSTVQLPMLNGYPGGGSGDYSGGTTMATAPQPILQQQYSLPLPNLRTKSDLLNIDHFLDQLQSTVYENPSQAAAAGVAQLGTHVVHANVNHRISNSPPTMHHGSAGHVSAHATAVTPVNANATIDTPALTPASSVLPYHSAHSPSSSHSNQSISPVSRGNPNVYPTLPAVSAMSDMSGSYAPASAAPASGLASAFDADGRRRYSGGQLQKAQPMYMDDDSSPSSRAESAEASMPKVDRLGLRSPSLKHVDPALRSPDGTESTDTVDNNNERWVENIRIIEALRAMVKEKLEKGDYEDDDDPAVAGAEQSNDNDAMETEHDRDAKSLYPVLRDLQGGD